MPDHDPDDSNLREAAMWLDHTFWRESDLLGWKKEEDHWAVYMDLYILNTHPDWRAVAGDPFHSWYRFVTLRTAIQPASPPFASDAQAPRWLGYEFHDVETSFLLDLGHDDAPFLHSNGCMGRLLLRDLSFELHEAQGPETFPEVELPPPPTSRRRDTK